ncbi:MAG: molybdenum cofactor guanylyltransferase, partial [Anaerolineales bacterium]
MVNYSVAIQAGGMSNRMGRDKGLLPFGAVTLVEHIINQIKPLGYGIYIISNSPEDYRFLGLPVYS